MQHDKTLSEYWTDRKSRYYHIRTEGKVTVTRVKSRLQIVCPRKNTQWMRAARNLGGKWRHRSCIWSLPASNKAEVLKALEDAFGQNSVVFISQP